MRMLALVLVVLSMSGAAVASPTAVTVQGVSATPIVQPMPGKVWTYSRTGQPPDSVKIMNPASNPVPVVMTGSTSMIPSSVRVTDVTTTVLVQPAAGSVFTYSRTGQPPDAVKVAGADPSVVLTTSHTGQPPEVVDQAIGKRWSVSDTLYQSASEASTVYLCSAALCATVPIDSDTVFYWLQVGPPDTICASDMAWSSEVSMEAAARGSGWPLSLYSPRVGDRLSAGRTLYVVPKYRDLLLYLLQHKR